MLDMMRNEDMEREKETEVICVVNPSFLNHDPNSSSVFGWLGSTLGRTACWSSLIGGPLDLCYVLLCGVNYKSLSPWCHERWNEMEGSMEKQGK